MSRVLGLLLLLCGFVLLYCGWQAQQASSMDMTGVVTGTSFGKSFALLSSGILVSVAGIYSVLRPS